MTLGILGALLLLLTLFMWWRGGSGWPFVVTAVLLGFIIASGNGPFNQGAHTIIGGLQTFIGAIAQMIDSGGKK